MDISNFKCVFLGQAVLRYEVPLEIFNIINSLYENKYPVNRGGDAVTDSRNISIIVQHSYYD